MHVVKNSKQGYIKYRSLKILHIRSFLGRLEIAIVAEEVGAFLWCEAGDEVSQGVPQRLDGPQQGL